MTANQRILNFPVIIVYTAVLTLIAALVQILFDAGGIAVPEGLDAIGGGLAEMGLSITVIAVSILTVITNLSAKQYFGITVGEYLKYGRGRFMPSFYDNLVVIVLMGAMQYAALALQAKFAAGIVFIEIIVLMVVQIRWGLGIAFFHYGKEKEIRTFLVRELEANTGVIANPARPRQAERAMQAVNGRIDQLLMHTRQAASLRSSAELASNLGMLTHVFRILLSPALEKAWRNFETRLDFLLSVLLQDSEQREYAVSELGRLLDIIIGTIDNGDSDNGIAKNCDFDNSRNQAYRLLSYAEPGILKSMFEQQIFYKLAVVKIYGIVDELRKISRYRYYAQQFAKSASESKYDSELNDMITGCVVALAPECFIDGKIREAGYYVPLLIESLAAQEMDTTGIAGELIKKYFECDGMDEGKKKSVYMLMQLEKEALGPQTPPGIELDEAEICMLDSFSKLVKKEKIEKDA